jgi:heat shock protein HslJ
MKRLALPLLVGAGLVGCAAEPVQLQQNRSYILEWIGERPLMDYSHLTVTLGDDGRAYGNGGCNHWFAPYTLEGDKLSFGPIGKTRKLCAPALMEQEQRFLQALQGVERWDISPIEQMRFWPAKASRCVGGWKRVDPAPRWTVARVRRSGLATSLHIVAHFVACNASSFAITPAAVCSPINCSRTLPLLSMM